MLIDAMSYLLWLIVAAASGWLVAQHQKRQRNFPPDYFKGLNYLLNEEPDKAIDVFIKLIDVDSDTVETHLAFGLLFRRRGEVNRAIRIHQNLIARATLNSQQRSLALFELALDYQSAGLFDRAEDLFRELVGVGTHQILALRKLLEIYQQEQDWNKAVDIAQQLAVFDNKPMHTVIAQFYCEQAEDYRRQGQNEAARQLIQKALKTDCNCVRASLIEGQLAVGMLHLEQAILAFQRVEQQDPNYLTEVIEPLQICYQTIGQPREFVCYLRRILERYGGITPMLKLAKIIKQQEGEVEAADFIVKQLHLHPSARGLDYLLDLVLSFGASISHEHLLLLKDITTQFLKNKPAYKCRYCGFTARKLHWQCPSCHQWNMLKPIQGIDGE
jgi:lipopolysaccharide biosynthesis regulator YciM